MVAQDKRALYEQRSARLQKALRYEAVDHVPVIYQGPAWGARSQGLSLGTFCTDPDAAIEATLGAMDSLGVDALNGMSAGCLPCKLTNLWLSEIMVPGINLPPDDLWQVREQEVMKPEDYDFIINNGYGAFLAQLLPRVHNRELWERDRAWAAANFAAAPGRYHARGYPILVSMNVSIPFEPFCGARSMEKFFLDCYRMPDKVKAAMDVALPYYINLTIAVTKRCGVMGTWVGGWRAASAMVSPKIWNRLVFPYYLEMVTRFQEAGILCVLHFDQNWDRDIERLREMPKGCVFSPDGFTDIRRAKQILGDHMAFLGDVPAQMLAAGTPDQVHRYTSDLIRDIGPRGLAMSSGCDIPFDAPKANVQAMVDAAHDYAVGA